MSEHVWDQSTGGKPREAKHFQAVEATLGPGTSSTRGSSATTHFRRIWGKASCDESSNCRKQVRSSVRGARRGAQFKKEPQ